MKALEYAAIQEYLERMRHMSQLIQYKEDQIKRLNELESVGIIESVKIADYKNELRLAIEELIDYQQGVESIISLLQDERLQMVLMLRYCLNLKWDDIAERMNYCYRNVALLHVQALQRLEFMVENGDIIIQ